MKLLIRSHTSTAAQVKLGMQTKISSHILYMYLLRCLHSGPVHYRTSQGICTRSVYVLFCCALVRYALPIPLKVEPLVFWHIPVSQIPQCIIQISYNAPFCNINVHTCAHFCYKIVHCGILAWCIVEFVRLVYCISARDVTLKSIGKYIPWNQ